MKIWWAKWGLALLALTAAVGCSGTAQEGAPEVIEGRSVCDECGMIIDDVRYAAALRLADGTPKVFDDIGGLLAWVMERGAESDGQRWVFDRHSGDAVPASEAFYVFSENEITPMGWGVVAFVDEAVATVQAEVKGVTVMGWEALVAAFHDGRLGIDDDHDHQMGEDHEEPKEMSTDHDDHKEVTA